MTKTIGIMGCGWFGLPLAIALIKKGYQVYGTTTSFAKIKTLQKEGIKPYVISCTENEIIGDISSFLESIDVLVVNIPPKLRGNSNENYEHKMRLLHQKIVDSSLQKLIFISSTSVYGDHIGDVTETTLPKPSTSSGKQLLAAEKIYKNDSYLKTTIVRFGGLVGENRNPVTVLSGKKDLANGHHPINLIHLDDCIRIISAILKNAWWNETFNGVYPKYCSKKDYYTREARKRGLPVPIYKTDARVAGKKIHSEVLLNVKGFKFLTTTFYTYTTK